MNRAEIEAILGEPALLIVTPENEGLLRDWALICGYPPVQVHSMSAVALANLYHGNGGTDAASRAVAEVMRALAPLLGRGTDPEALRALVREEIAAQAAALVQRIEIRSPSGVTILPGRQHHMTPRVIKMIARNDPVMMVGPAGSGKTTIGELAATALQLPFYVTNAINEEHQLKDFIDGYGKYHSTPFRMAFENGGIWIADEIDAWDANALLAANSALANGFTVFPDIETPIRRHADFRMVATANTFGSGADRVYVGRNELDAASLDRFGVITIDYDRDLERMLSNGEIEWLEHVWAIRDQVEAKHIRHVVSTRAIIMGSKAIIDGETWEDVEASYLIKGMSQKDREKIE